MRVRPVAASVEPPFPVYLEVKDPVSNAGPAGFDPGIFPNIGPATTNALFLGRRLRVYPGFKPIG